MHLLYHSFVVIAVLFSMSVILVLSECKAEGMLLKITLNSTLMYSYLLLAVSREEWVA